MIARIFSGIILVWLLGFAWFAVALPGPADLRRTDGIVVPTGSPDRVRRGLALLADHHARRMLVSGADRRVRPDELAEAYKVPRALVACCVDIGYEAVDTRSNADETAAWARRHKFHSIRLVTTDWHMRRARYELARQLGPDVEIVGDAVRSVPAFTALFKEYNKYVLRRMIAPFGL